MAEDRREQELRAAAKQLAGVQRQHRPDQTAATQAKSGQQTVAAQSQAGQKAQPQRAAQQATAQRAAAQPQAGQKAQPQRAAQQATAQTAAAQPQAGQKAQPQRATQQVTGQTAQQATAQTAHSNGSGKALSGQQIQQMRTTNTPAKESMSQTKQIQHQLEQEVADIMDAESFADLVFIDPDPLPETSKKEEGRTGFFAKRNKDKETDTAAKAAVKAETSQSKDKETAVSAGHTEYKETAVDKTAEQAQEADKQEEQIEKLQKWGRIGQWFQTFCWMHIPIFGFWYMVVLAVRKRTPEEKKTFARAYVLYRVLVMLLALTILYVFYRMGLSFVEQILAYIDMHS